MRKRFVLLTLPLLLTALIAGGIAVSRSFYAAAQLHSDGQTGRAVIHGVSNGAGELSEGNAGRKIFVDPITGQNVSPPAQAAGPVLPLPAEHPLSTSGEGLREVPVVTRGGGVKVHLQGRFRSSVIATVGPDEKLTTRCVTQCEGEDHDAVK